jgi:acyl homoserine lactone synthase
MQVIAFDGTESARTEDLLRQSFKLRAQVFDGRLHWDVRVSGGQERDIFDRLQPTYLAAVTRDDTVVGSVRLLPANGPTMLSTVFSKLLSERAIPDLRHFVEASRFCVDTGHHRSGHVLHDATRSLFAAMVEWSLRHGYAGIVAVVDLRMERVLRRAGWVLSRLGPPQPMGVTWGVAGLLPVSARQLPALRPDTYDFLDLGAAPPQPTSQELKQSSSAMAQSSQMSRA